MKKRIKHFGMGLDQNKVYHGIAYKAFTAALGSRSSRSSKDDA